MPMKILNRSWRYAALTIIMLWVVAIVAFAQNDRFKTGFWDSTNRRTLLKELKEGTTTYHARTVYAGSEETLNVYADLWQIGVASGLPQIVIDLSNTVDWPHTDTGYVVFDDLSGTMCLQGATGAWDLQIGVITENDETDGTASWFFSTSIRGPEHTCREVSYRPLRRISMALDGETPIDFATATKEVSGDWSSSNALLTLFGTTTPPAVGDIVVRYTEVTDGATLKMSVNTHYKTR
jgi:hypothetical protein